MKKIIIAITFTLTLLLSSTSITLAAPFDLTYSADNTKNYTFNQFIDRPDVFDFVAANLGGYEIEGLDGTRYNAQEINNRTILGMTFVQAVASIQATAAVVTAEGSHLQADADAAQALITALPNGTDKTALQDRLNIVIALIPVIPPAPSVTMDDIANTVSSMSTAMEYKLDAAPGYVAYDSTSFGLIDFSGEHTLLVRVAAEGINPPSADTTLTFTTNPGPPVTNNDVTDMVSGMTTAMEYSFDGAAYVQYDEGNFIFGSLNFEGAHTLLVRYVADPTGPVTTLIFTQRPGPSVTRDDVANIVTGMTTAMEYSYDGASYVVYDPFGPAWGNLDFNGDHTLLVRYWADGMNWSLPSIDTILTFTANPGPAVTRDDTANTVTGMTTAMEYNLDGVGYVPYDASIFDALDLSGEHTILVRLISDPTGPVATLIFTTNPVAPPAPLVTNDDVANTVAGMAVGMEYNYDGTGYVMYEMFGFSFGSLDFNGNHILLVRYAAVEAIPASLVTTLTFTTNPARPGPAVTNDDVTNTVTGMTSAMEYNYDGNGYVMYNGFFGPDIAFNALDFNGNHTLLVRYAEDFMNGYPASLDTTLTFTTNPATLVSIVITTPATKTTYKAGDVLSLTGLVVTGTYSDNTTRVETITAANITGFDSTTPLIGQTLTITVGGKTTTYIINILIVTLNKTTTSVLLGMTDTLIATVLPNDAPNKNVTWSAAGSLNPVTVVNGVITGVGMGISTVTITTVDGSITASCFVTVTNEANILNNFNLGRTMTYIPGFILQFGDAIGLNLTAYRLLTLDQQYQVQQAIIYAPTFTILADIRDAFDLALASVILDPINYATVDTMGATLEASASALALDLTFYNLLSPEEQLIVNGYLLLPTTVGVYYANAAQVQAALAAAVLNAPAALTVLAEINTATVDTISGILANNAVLLGINLDSYTLYGDPLTINTALDAQIFTNSYDLQLAIDAILYDLTITFIDPFNIAGMDTIAMVITDNAAALGLDLTAYASLSPAQQEIVHGYLVSQPYFISGYYSLAALHTAFNEAVTNAPTAEIALAAINTATESTIYDLLTNNSALLRIDLAYFDPATMSAVLVGQGFTNTFDLQMAIYYA